MAAHAPAPQRTGRLDVAEDREARCRMAPQTQNSSSLATRTLRRQTPKVGAVCGKPACTDLCGGTGVTRCPTAITTLQGSAGRVEAVVVEDRELVHRLLPMMRGLVPPGGDITQCQPYELV